MHEDRRFGIEGQDRSAYAMKSNNDKIEFVGRVSACRRSLPRKAAHCSDVHESPFVYMWK